jgi:hypothetical protein
MDLSDLIDCNAAFAPDKAAIRTSEGTLSYRWPWPAASLTRRGR